MSTHDFDRRRIIPKLSNGNFELELELPFPRCVVENFEFAKKTRVVCIDRFGLVWFLRQKYAMVQ
jgi:hypothetical protein